MQNHFILFICTPLSLFIYSSMASVLHGNCLKVPLAHGHSHGGGGGGHGHSHSHNRPCQSSSQLATYPASGVTTKSNSGGPAANRKDDAVLAHGVINIHSTSIHTTHSRHNSFSKTLPNGGNLLSDSIGDLNGGAVSADKSSSYTR